MLAPQQVPEPLIADLLAQLGIPRPSWLREGITFRDSFAELVAQVFQGEKIVLVDALLPELRRAGAPLFHQIAQRAVEVQSALTARSSALAKAAQLGIPRPSWLREGITFRDSFAELVAQVFQGEKIVLEN